MKVLQENAPGCIREQTIKSFFGRKIAIDASMCLYQFLIAVRQDGQNLANEEGEVTSHLQGFFYRTMRMLDAGIKPVYVFDGKPPEMKTLGELQKRAERRKETNELLESLKAADRDDEQRFDENGEVIDTLAEVDKLERRLVRVTREQNLEVQTLLTYMGIPWIEATCEAEATCAELSKKGLVYAVGTEDMDALTFGSTKLIRNLTVSESRGLPIFEIDFAKILQILEMNHSEFVDLCILLGCDYTGGIRGIGPHRALELIQKYRTIEAAIPTLDAVKHPVVDEEFQYQAAADLFLNADVADVKDVVFEWKKPDEDGLITFLCTEKGFSEERVRNGIKRLLEARKHMTQQRLEGWFKPGAAPATAVKNPAKIAQEKRLEEEKKKAAEAKKRKSSSAQPDAVKKARK
jgi:flap endonuclease-1